MMPKTMTTARKLAGLPPRQVAIDMSDHGYRDPETGAPAVVYCRWDLSPDAIEAIYRAVYAPDWPNMTDEQMAEHDATWADRLDAAIAETVVGTNIDGWEATDGQADSIKLLRASEDPQQLAFYEFLMLATCKRYVQWAAEWAKKKGLTGSGGHDGNA